MKTIRAAVLGTAVASLFVFPALNSALAQETKKPEQAQTQAATPAPKPAPQAAATQPKKDEGQKKAVKRDRRMVRKPAAHTQGEKPAAQQSTAAKPAPSNTPPTQR